MNGGLKMLYQEINPGVSMPMLGFGTFMNMGSDCERSVAEAIRAGYRLIDTAEAYGNEEQVGAGIKVSGIDRKELFLVTKVNFKSYGHTRKTVENSISRLGTDYLDLVLLHWPFSDYYTAWRELEKLHAEGLIRTIGVSNFEPDRLIDLIAYNDVKPAVNQIETHLYCQRQAEHAWEKKYGVAHMAFAPLGQGKANEMFEEPVVVRLAEKYRKTPAQVLLRRSLQDGVTVIPKSVHAQRIAENIDVFDFELTADEMAELRCIDRAAPMIGMSEKPELVEMSMQW
jgi:2,5-diketo-D-gluconate reductase A